jgi:F-type H+-transporting ATPase subunit b
MATETHESTEAAGHGESSGGLPQFDLQWWPGQIAWTLIVFLVVLAFMRLFAVPRLGGAIAEREERIVGDMAEARRLKEEAEAQAQAAATERAQARAASQKLAQEARAKAQAESAARLAEEEAKLAETTGNAEAGIAAARDQAMASVRDIAADTAKAIVEKLTGRAATAAEAAAAAQAVKG